MFVFTGRDLYPMFRHEESPEGALCTRRRC